jgi:Ca-activated chloride channel family protein
MPVEGNNATAAVALATTVMAAESLAGTILVIADGIGDEAAVRRVAGRNGVLMLSVAPPQSDLRGNLRADTVRASVDNSDIRSLERRIETRYQSAQSAAFGTRWRDEGYWLLLPAALLGLLWFRRGTAVAWIVALLIIQHAAPAGAADASRFRDLWLTPDQQGRIAFDQGDYAAAKELFADPMWRGVAAYRAYDFLAAAESFRKIEGPAGSRWAMPKRKTTLMKRRSRLMTKCWPLSPAIRQPNTTRPLSKRRSKRRRKKAASRKRVRLLPT